MDEIYQGLTVISERMEEGAIGWEDANVKEKEGEN